jgi:hypothetical protein
MICFDLYYWPSSGGSVVYIKEKTMSERGLSFTNVKHCDDIKVIIPKSGVILR